MSCSVPCHFFFPWWFCSVYSKKLFWEVMSTQSFGCLEIIYYSFLVYSPENVWVFFPPSHTRAEFSLFQFTTSGYLQFVATSQQLVSQCAFIPTVLSWVFAFQSCYLLVLNSCSCSWHDFCLESSVSVCQWSVPGGGTLGCSQLFPSFYQPYFTEHLYLSHWFLSLF